MFEFESVAKTVDRAIEEGLSTLNLHREDVDIKIIETGGFLKKAKVLLIVPEEIACSNEEIKKLKKIKNIEEKALNQVIEDAVEVNQVNLSSNKEKTKERAFNQSEECKNFLEDFLTTIKVEANIDISETEENIFISINGDNLSKLIGYHGDSLNSLQYLTSVYCSKFSRHAKKVILDIDGFKEKRKETLEELANRIANKVISSGKRNELEPMNAFERRIIHNVIQNYPELKSFSNGTEPNRYLIIDIKKD